MTVLETAEKWLPAGPRLVRALLAEDETARAQRMAAIAFAIRIVSAAIAFLSQIIQARLMGEFEYGIFVFVWVLVVLAGSFSSLGFPTAVIRFLPQYDLDKAEAEIRGLTMTARVFAMSCASLSTRSVWRNCCADRLTEMRTGVPACAHWADWRHAVSSTQSPSV